MKIVLEWEKDTDYKFSVFVRRCVIPEGYNAASIYDREKYITLGFRHSSVARLCKEKYVARIFGSIVWKDPAKCLIHEAGFNSIEEAKQWADDIMLKNGCKFISKQDKEKYLALL